MTQLSPEANRLRMQKCHNERRAAQKCILCGCFLRAKGFDICWECRKRKNLNRKKKTGLAPNISVWETLDDGLGRAIMEADHDLLRIP